MVTDPGNKPRGIVVDVENRLMQISWGDGHDSIYDFALLRHLCPCAECRPWIEGVGEVGAVPESVRQASIDIRSLQDVSPVGSYALNIRWADGHASGIYTFEYLRRLCPCEEHRERRALEGDQP